MLHSRFHQTLVSSLSVLMALGFAAFASEAKADPGATWATRTPPQVGLDVAKLNELSSLVGGDGMIVRNGFLVFSWGDIQEPRNWASASKPVLSTLLFLATDRGLCTPGSTMGQYLPGGSVKDRSITFHSLANMLSGYSRGENPGAAWAYNDHAIQLYGYTLFHEVFGGDPSAVVPNELAFLQFEDAPLVSDTQYGRLVGVSIRDFARLGLFWLNQGQWNGVQRIPSVYFGLIKNNVSTGVPLSTQDGAESWDFGTFGGGDGGGDLPDGEGPGEYGYNFWVNTNGFWPGAPRNLFAAVGHGGNESCIVIPSLGIVAAGVGAWDHPSTAAVQLLIEAAGSSVPAPQNLRTESWGGIKEHYTR